MISLAKHYMAKMDRAGFDRVGSGWIRSNRADRICLDSSRVGLG